MSFNDLPEVGANAALTGMAAFTQNVKSLISGLTSINKASEDLASSSTSSWNQVADSASRGAAIATAAAKQASAALNKAFSGAGGVGGGGKPPTTTGGNESFANDFNSQNTIRDQQRAIDELDRIRSKNDLDAFNRRQAMLAKLAAAEQAADDEIDAHRTKNDVESLRRQEKVIAQVAADREAAENRLIQVKSKDDAQALSNQLKLVEKLALEQDRLENALNDQRSKNDFELFKQRESLAAKLAAEQEKADAEADNLRSKRDAERFKEQQARIKTLALDQAKADRDRDAQANRDDVARVREHQRIVAAAEREAQAELTRAARMSIQRPSAVPIATPNLGRRAIDEATAGVERLNKATLDLGHVGLGSWASFGKNASISSATVVRASGTIAIAIAIIGAALTAVLGPVANFQASLKNIQILSEGTGHQMEGLTKTTLDLSKQFGISTAEVQKTETALIKGGASLDQLEGGALTAAIALQKATLGEVDFSAATDLIIQGLNQYGLSANEAARVSNAIAGAANKSTASVSDLAAAFKQAVIPEAVGASIEDVSTALAILNSNGLRGSVAGTTLRNTFLRLLNPSDEALKIMEKYNISVFNAQGRSLGFRNVLNQLITAFGQTGDAAKDAERTFDAATLFGARQGSAISVFAREGIAAFDQLKAEITDTSAIGLANKQLDSLVAQFGRVTAAISALVITGFTPLVNALTPITKNLADFLGNIDPVSSALAALNTSIGGALIGNFQALAAAVDLLKGALGGVNFDAIVTTLSTNLVDALEILRGAIITATAVVATLVGELRKIPAVAAAVDTAMKAAPYLVVAAGAITAASAVASLTASLLGLRAVFAITVVGVRTLAIGVGFIASVGVTLLATVAAIASVVSGFAELLLIVGLVVATYAHFADANKSVVQNLGDLATAAANLAISIGNGLLNALDNIATAVANSDLGKQVIALFSAAADIGLSILDQFTGGAISLFGAMVNGIVNTTIVLPKFISDIFNLIVVALNNLGKDLNTWVSGWAQAWADVANAVAQALQAAANTIASFLGSLPPQIAGLLGGLFDGAKNFVAQTFVPGISKAFGELAPNVAATFEGIRADIEKNVKAATDSIQAQIRATQDNLRALEIARGRNEADKPLPGRGRPNREFPDESDTGRTFPPGGGGGGGAKEPTIRALSKQIQAALADLPGAGKELADFLANIAKDAPERLAPMITALHQVKVEISQTVLAARDLAVTNNAIAESNTKITQLQAAQNRIEIAQNIALLGFDRQLLGLRFQILQITQEEAPIRDKLRDVEDKIAKLQRDNLDLTRQRLQLQLEMLPIQNQLADIEQRITDAQKPNVILRQQQAQIALDILPTQQKIADIEKQISETQRVNYTLVNAINANNVASLPLRQAIADIDRQSNAIRTDDIHLVKQRATLEAGLIDQRRAIFDIDQQINKVEDKRLSLELRRSELLANQSIAASQDQLDILDKSLAKETNTSKLRDLAKQRDAVAASMETQQDALKKINRDQERQQTAEELRVNALQLQKQAIIDQLQPTQDLIDKIQFEEGVYTQLANLQKITLEEQKRALEDQLKPLDDVGFKLAQQQEREAAIAEQRRGILEAQKQGFEDEIATRVEIITGIQRQLDLEAARQAVVVAGLDIEKAKLDAILRPLQDRLTALERIQSAEQLENQIAITFLEAERRALEDSLKPMEDRRIAIERQIAQIDLEREATRISFEEQKGIIQEQLLAEQLRRAELEETRLKQQAVFEQQALGLLQAIVNTQAFSSSEAAEVAKRLNLWDSEVEAIQKRVDNLSALQDAAGLANTILSGVADKAKDTTIELNDLTDAAGESTDNFLLLNAALTDGTQPAVENLTMELNTNNRPAFEKLTRELDSNHRPALEHVTRELDENNRPAFEHLTDELDSNNRPAFEKLTLELDTNNRPALENVTKELDSNNRPAFESLTNELNSNNTPAFKNLTSELNTGSRPALEGVTQEANTGTTPSMNALASAINTSTKPALDGAKHSLDDVATAAQNAKAQLDAIPREITIIVRYVTVGSPPGGSPPQAGGGGGAGAGGGGGGAAPAPSDNSSPGSDTGGGADLGGSGGGSGGGSDSSLSLGRTRSVNLVSANTRAAGATNTTVQNITNFDLDPHYQSIQSPANLSMDIRALIALSQRG